MKNLSRWARNHVATARLMIIISQICLAFLAIFLANELTEREIQLSPLWIVFGIILFFIAAVIYRNKNVHRRYAIKKSFDLFLAGLGFCLVLFFANNLNKPFISYDDANAALAVKDPSYQNPEAQKLLEEFKSGAKTEFTAREKRIIKKEFRYQLKRYAVAKISGDKKASDDALLIILACIAAVGLLILIGALACNISCSGSDAAAVVLVIVGTAAVIWGLVAVIKGIQRKSKK